MKLRTRAIIGICTYPLIIMGLMFGLGGDWGWLPGWRFLILFMGMVIMVMIPIMKDKKMLEERMKMPFDNEQKPIDKFLVGLVVIFYMGWLIIIPLDAKRFAWSPEFPTYLTTLGAALFLLASVMMYHVFSINAFLAQTVKKQENHKVVDHGLYAIVRHPMYSAAILMTFAGSFVVSSLAGIGISIILAIVFYARTFHEEDVLGKELEGYREYKKKVRGKLIPWIF